MDINDLRGIGTLLCMAGFLSVVFWAYSSRRHKDFEEAEMLPFADGDGASKAKDTEKSE